jgi:hypothetical protein
VSGAAVADSTLDTGHSTLRGHRAGVPGHERPGGEHGVQTGDQGAGDTMSCEASGFGVAAWGFAADLAGSNPKP